MLDRWTVFGTWPAVAARLKGAVVALGMLICGAASAVAQPAGGGGADHQPPTEILSQHDADTYQQIFAVQEQGHWGEADRLIARLHNPLLMGHVLHQRYMHPTAYRSQFGELQAWLQSYADHPGADTVHRLARQRGSGTLVAPRGRELQGSGGAPGARISWTLQGSYASAAARQSAQRVWTQFRSALHRGQTLVIKRLAEDAATARALSSLDHDRLMGALAYAYFLDGRDDWTLDWANRALARSGDRVPMALWAAGLAHWRQGSFNEAGRLFERLSYSPDATPWLISAGAYWASRAALRDRRPADSSGHLATAAEYPRTFYGLLAHRALGLPLPFRWEEQRQTSPAALAADFAHAPGGQRALALAQVGRQDMAERELRLLYSTLPEHNREDVMRLAEASGLSSLALYLAARESNDGEDVDGLFDAARYPVPHWSPEDGWRLDRAVVFAFMRQESGFNPSARSHAGAQGLMQVMPATAAYIEGDSRLRQASGRAELLSPERNMAIGQRYIEYLLTLPEVGGDLFRAAAAYNGGPGNLRRWMRNNTDSTDPLLFVESIPSRETRLYVERVMTNLWIYHSRFGQDMPTLDRVVAGQWPGYAPQDRIAGQLASTP